MSTWIGDNACMVSLFRGYCIAVVLIRIHNWYCSCSGRHHRRFAPRLSGLVMSAHDNLEVIAATPLQLQTFWPVGKDVCSIDDNCQNSVSVLLPSA